MKSIFMALILIGTSAAFADFSTTRKYKDVTGFLHKLATQYPEQVELFTLGFSDRGVAIEGVRIGKGPIHNLVVAAHHGNEYGSVEVAVNFAEHLAQMPIPGQTITVIPVLNTEGYDSRSRWERVNGQSIDPNRDYPGPCGSEGPFYLRSTKALADYIEKTDVIAAATIHTYWPAAIYPWGLSTHDLDTPYTPIFMNMVKAATEASQYQVGNSAEVIYPADGTFEDYAFWKHGVWSILFEIGRSHYPNLSDIQTMVKVNSIGLRRMFEVAPKTKAADHEFHGQCDMALRALDMHIE